MVDINYQVPDAVRGVGGSAGLRDDIEEYEYHHQPSDRLLHSRHVYLLDVEDARHLLYGRLPRIGRRVVDAVVELDDTGAVLVMGYMFYRADNPIHAGSSRGRFLTILKPDVVVAEAS